MTQGALTMLSSDGVLVHRPPLLILHTHVHAVGGIEASGKFHEVFCSAPSDSHSRWYVYSADVRGIRRCSGHVVRLVALHGFSRGYPCQAQAQHAVWSPGHT